jgi:hypothetical protein
MRLAILATAMIAALPLAAAGHAAAQGCLKADDTAEVKITGTLVIAKFKHPNGTPLQAYVVRLPKVICADVTDANQRKQRVFNINRVQVSGELDERTFNALLNKRVTIGGTLFGQHTAYHTAPILIQMKSIDAAK